MAATIQECIDDVAEDIGTKGADVVTRMGKWLKKIFIVPTSFPPPGAPWNQDNIDQRSVYDWAVPSILANAQIQSAGNGNQLSLNIAINVVLRTLLAVQSAQNNGRITAAQQTSVVTAYTAIWELP